MLAPHKDDVLIHADKSHRPEAKIYCDGASSGNPGHAGIGVVIRRQNPDIRTQTTEGRLRTQNSELITRISEYIGIATNNVAEYIALIRGLKKARSLGLKKIDILLDSELLVRQIKGIYKIKSAKLRPFWEEAQNVLKQFDSYKITHIPRELNKEADLLARRAIKNLGS